MYVCMYVIVQKLEIIAKRVTGLIKYKKMGIKNYIQLYEAIVKACNSAKN